MTRHPNASNPTLKATVATLSALLATVAVPDVAGAALRAAAGGSGGSEGGFARFVEFINRLADYTIPIGSAFAVLGLIWGGLLFVAGDTRAGRILGLVALGVGVILLSKPIAA